MIHHNVSGYFRSFVRRHLGRSVVTGLGLLALVTTTSFVISTVNGSDEAAVVAAADEPAKPKSKPTEAKPEEKSEKVTVKSLIGTWKYVSSTKDGVTSDAEALKSQSVVIAEDKLTLKGEATFVLKYELDEKAAPATMKLEITDSPFGAGAKAGAIVEFDGKKLKFCYGTAGEKAPEKFESPAGSTNRLLVLEKSEPEKKADKKTGEESAD